MCNKIVIKVSRLGNASARESITSNICKALLKQKFLEVPHMSRFAHRANT